MTPKPTLIKMMSGMRRRKIKHPNLLGPLTPGPGPGRPQNPNGRKNGLGAKPGPGRAYPGALRGPAPLPMGRGGILRDLICFD
mmetsp:Transcript_12053/g.18019  ORF Transcript_12053/g.18019 Transcript_12053/m.18019 type:complete len:83 (-) Transcript_12053:27-275(-)